MGPEQSGAKSPKAIAGYRQTFPHDGAVNSAMSVASAEPESENCLTEDARMVRSRKTIFLSIGVAASTIFAALLLYGSFHHGTSAQAALAPELISALPMGAQSLVYIDLGAMRASPFYQQRPDKGPIAIPNQDYADFIRSTGFDFEKDLDRVVMASWPGPSAKETKKAVVIAEGRFDRAKIREYALRKGKLDHQQGHEVFLFPSTVAGMPAGMNSITFLDGHRLALVSGPSIAPLFEHS